MKKVNNTDIKIGLALSGGGSRAIAFHLGCFKALHELGLLNNVDTISSVSGGSFISALFAYKNYSFEEFEAEVISMLRKGFQWSIFKTAFSPMGFLMVVNFILFATYEVGRIILLILMKIIKRFISGNLNNLQNFLSIPFPRHYTRTTLFEKFLMKNYFDGLKINSHTRNGVNIVINACELRTGTAFRFGNLESGCWRYGKIKNNNIALSTAVVASAAYPVLLPAIDKKWELVDRDNNTVTERLLITDGGVYENLGISCLEPDKNPKYSYNAFASDFIICCNAGHGQFEKNSYPGWWGTRMVRAFLTIFKNILSNYSDKLHIYKETNKIYGFIYSYLGQIDQNLPMDIDDFVTRQEVIDYPTDFAAMPGKYIQKLSQRGYQLTKNLLNYYHSELL